MDYLNLKWIILIFALFVVSFGFSWTLVILIVLCAFILGFFTLLYVQEGNIDNFYKKCAGNPLTDSLSTLSAGLGAPLSLLASPKQSRKCDTRVTGSDLIDTSLQEILSFIIRDYFSTWYSTVSLDTEFPERTVKSSIQNFAINLSNKVKDIDWIPYLTTNLVDDAATHLRLFKQARNKLTETTTEGSNKSPSRSSPRKENKRSSPKRAHKRNKSETDIAKYFTSKGKENDRNMGNSRFCSRNGGQKAPTLEDHFFDLECLMEKNFLCRDIICVENVKEKEFISDLVELVLYILLPEEDFECTPLRYLVREIISNCVLLPVFTLISDPDFINQSIIWLCLRDAPLPSEIFLTTLRISDNIDELNYTKELLLKEIQQMRSGDSSAETEISIKQQLSSLYYVQKLIDNRLLKINNGEYQVQLSDCCIPLENIKKVDLPLDVILKNNVALSYFIDFVSSQSKQSYLFFYLNIEGWKVSVEQQLSDLHRNKMKGVNLNSGDIYDNIRSTALSIYDQYLGEKRQFKVDLNSNLVHNLFFKIKKQGELPSEQWFDEIQSAIYDVLQNQPEFVPSFKKSNSYLKLLEELDLLQFHIPDEDSASLTSLENLEEDTLQTNNVATVTVNPVSTSSHFSNTLNADNSSTIDNVPKSTTSNLFNSSTNNITTDKNKSLLPNASSQGDLHLSDAYEAQELSSISIERQMKEDSHCPCTSNPLGDGSKVESDSNYLSVINGVERYGKHARSLSDVTDFTTKEVKERGNLATEYDEQGTELKDEDAPSLEKQKQILRLGEFTLAVNIIETGIVCERGKTFGIYATHVMRQYDNGFLEEWHIYRRYSDFYDLHTKIKDKFPDLSKLTFPGKKTFHNMDRSVLEKRMSMLGEYLRIICQPNVITSHHGLRELLMVFLEQGDYDRATSGGPIANTIDTLVNPIKSGMRTIKNMPEQISNTVDEFVEGINKVFHTKPGSKSQEGLKVGAALDIETDDNIPLRIILLLMDEVFDLKSRNQWLRRRIITLLRQIVRTMFGDIVNRRILEYVSLMTSPKNVAYYLQTFKQTFWPNGVKAEERPERDEGVKSRTRVAAKVALLSCLSDELKHIIGSETTRKGLLTIFELIQRPILNRRLLYVLLEGVLTTLFRDKDMDHIFKKMYSKSPRYQEKQRYTR